MTVPSGKNDVNFIACMSEFLLQKGVSLEQLVKDAKAVANGVPGIPALPVKNSTSNAKSRNRDG